MRAMAHVTHVAAFILGPRLSWGRSAMEGPGGPPGPPDVSEAMRMVAVASAVLSAPTPPVLPFEITEWFEVEPCSVGYGGRNLRTMLQEAAENQMELLVVVVAKKGSRPISWELETWLPLSWSRLRGI